MPRKKKRGGIVQPNEKKNQSPRVDIESTFNLSTLLNQKCFNL